MKTNNKISLKEKELTIRIWFLENELYSDGSNVHLWLPQLKLTLEEIFELNLNLNENK